MLLIFKLKKLKVYILSFLDNASPNNKFYWTLPLTLAALSYAALDQQGQDTFNCFFITFLKTNQTLRNNILYSLYENDLKYSHVSHFFAK